MSNENSDVSQENELLANFIPEEVKWIRSIEKNEKFLKELELNKKEFRSDIRLIQNYNKWLEKILKYENLRLENLELYKPYKRLIRLHSRILTGWLDKKNYEYVVMNGLYIVRTVYFFEAEKLEKYLGNITKVTKEDLGLPENYILSTAKLIRNNKNEKLAVCLAVEGEDDEIYNQYLKGARYSVWNYPIF